MKEYTHSLTRYYPEFLFGGGLDGKSVTEGDIEFKLFRTVWKAKATHYHSSSLYLKIPIINEQIIYVT